MTTRFARPTLPALLLGALTLAACAGGGDDAPPVAAAPPPPTPQAQSAAPRALSAAPETDPRGVIDYGDYAVVQARDGDSVEAMAARVGLSASELAAYNGLPTGYRPRRGDELVLPPRPQGYRPAAGAAAIAPAPTAGALSAAPLSTPAPALSAADNAADNAADAPIPGDGGQWSPALIDSAIGRADGGAAAPTALPSSGGGFAEVGYHEVKDGETVYSIARLYGVPAASIISWNALRGPDYSVSAGEVLTIPAGAQATEVVPAAVPGAAATAAPPPSAGAPLPADTVRAEPLKSPQLGQYQTLPSAAEPTPEPTAKPAPTANAAATSTAAPAGAGSTAAAATGATLSRPVPGRVIRPYNRSSGGGRNDGVDFAAKAGEPVTASADGTVALISNSPGSWGNIVLVRHDGGIMTVYGRMGEINVTKGQQVLRGQALGTVAEGSPASLYFEVRRGAFSENPEDFF